MGNRCATLKSHGAAAREVWLGGAWVARRTAVIACQCAAKAQCLAAVQNGSCTRATSGVDSGPEFGIGIVGVEIKASAAPSSADAAHLSFVRDRLGDRFLGGAVLHTGPRAFVLSDRILALPICALWG